MRIQLPSIIVVIASMVLSACQAPYQTVKPGDWTDDLLTAKQVARKSRLPMLLSFTGADWCAPCIEMEKEVFSKPEWKIYAKNNLIMVAIDISIEEMRDMRNAVPRKDAIRKQYDVRGYPTFVLLDDNGETPLGWLGGRRLRALGEPSPETFRQLLRPYLHYWSVEVDRALASMNTQDRERYRGLVEQRKEITRDFLDVLRDSAEARRKVWYITAQMRELEEQLKNVDPNENRADQRALERIRKHKELTAELDRLEAEKKQARLCLRETEMPLWSRHIVENLKKVEEEMRNIRVAQLSEAEQTEYAKLVELEKEAERYQGSIEDKMKYYKLAHQRTTY